MADDNAATVADPASLQNLHDIVVPDPVAWWPPAPGWYVLGAMLLIAAVLLTLRLVVNYRANRYRRAGQEQLAELRKLSHDSANRDVAIAQTGELLKRVAIAAWPRDNVANLSGKRWLTFLNETGDGTLISDKQGRIFSDILYCRKIGEQLSPNEVEELFDLADRWIRKHDGSIPATKIGKEDSEC